MFDAATSEAGGPCADGARAENQLAGSTEGGGCVELGGCLQEDLCWLLARASRAMACAMAKGLAALSLDTRGLMVMKTISASSARTQLALAQATDIDKTTLIAVLDDLERKLLVRRSPDANDRRVRVVELTDEGRKMLAWAEVAGGDIQRAVLDDLDPANREAVLRSLPLLIQAIDRVALGIGS
jgi:DNA-binding MarR family transcriptional regulator